MSKKPSKNNERLAAKQDAEEGAAQDVMRQDLAAAVVALRDLEHLVPIYFSGIEAGVVASLLKRAHAWLSPEEPEPLLEAMQNMVAAVQSAREVRRQQEEARNAAADHAADATRRARDAMHAKQEAHRKAREEMQQRAVARNAG
jgi:hypothetical protein